MEKWNFPSNNFGTVTGIGEAGIETFNGSPYVSLTREICQNSMDARMDESKPVIVEFSSFEMGCKSIPDYNGLNNAVRSCLDFWTENHNKKTIDFFNKAVSVMNRDRVMVLRVSDFNTTGLTGSDKEYNTPWQNLVKAAGVSDKGGSAGGSYGIGKSAQFACSDLRTLFYTTVDVNGLEASQGIARLVSFREKSLFGKEKDSITTGIGYYSNDKKNSAIRKCISLQQGYERNVPGTDIYIIGFKKIPTWKDEVITAVLEDFLIALYNRELIVHIDDIEISADTLDSMIEKYKELGNNPYMRGVGSLQFDNPVKTTVEVKIMSVRLFLSDKTKNEYTLVFTPTKDLVGGYLQFFFDGEKNTTRKNDRIPVPISSAIDKNTENVLSCVGNKIQIGDVTARKKGKVKFVIDYDDECAMEVNLYGYPS